MKEKIREQIEELIKTPTVSISSNDLPIEYRDAIHKRVHKKRDIPKIGVELAMFTIENGGQLEDLQKFASGDLVGFINRNNAYVSNDIIVVKDKH